MIKRNKVKTKRELDNVRSTRINDDLAKRLHARATKEKRTEATIIRRALEEHLA